MISEKAIYFVISILCLFISCHVGNSDLIRNGCEKSAVYDITSISGRLYLRNMVSLFTVLSSNASQPSGFYNYTSGAGTAGHPVYGLFLCRGDATANECQTCVKSAVAEILHYCPNVSRATTWFDHCMLRYSDQPIISKVEAIDGWSAVWVDDINNVTDGALLNRTLAEVFTKITNEAAYGNNVPGKKYAVAEANYTALVKIFALGQCTPDISNSDCEFCLRSAVTFLSSCCMTSRPMAWGLLLSCNLRYSTLPFYHSVHVISPPPPQLAPLLPPTPLPGGISSASIAGLISPIAVATVAFVVAFFIGAV